MHAIQPEKIEPKPRRLVEGDDKTQHRYAGKAHQPDLFTVGFCDERL